jgi:hypothetical protein
VIQLGGERDGLFHGTREVVRTGLRLAAAGILSAPLVAENLEKSDGWRRAISTALFTHVQVGMSVLGLVVLMVYLYRHKSRDQGDDPMTRAHRRRVVLAVVAPTILAAGYRLYLYFQRRQEKGPDLVVRKNFNQPQSPLTDANAGAAVSRVLRSLASHYRGLSDSYFPNAFVGGPEAVVASFENVQRLVDEGAVLRNAKQELILDPILGLISFPDGFSETDLSLAGPEFTVESLRFTPDRIKQAAEIRARLERIYPVLKKAPEDRIKVHEYRERTGDKFFLDPANKLREGLWMLPERGPERAAFLKEVRPVWTAIMTLYWTARIEGIHAALASEAPLVPSGTSLAEHLKEAWLIVPPFLNSPLMTVRQWREELKRFAPLFSRDEFTDSLREDAFIRLLQSNPMLAQVFSDLALEFDPDFSFDKMTSLQPDPEYRIQSYLWAEKKFLPSSYRNSPRVSVPGRRSFLNAFIGRPASLGPAAPADRLPVRLLQAST